MENLKDETSNNVSVAKIDCCRAQLADGMRGS